MGCLLFEITFQVQTFITDYEIRDYTSDIKPDSFKYLDECKDENIRECIKSLLEINPKKRPSAAKLHKSSASNLWQGIAETCKEKGLLEASIKAYRKGTEADPNSPALWKGLVSIYEAKELAVRQELAESNRLRAEQESELHRLQEENSKFEQEHSARIKAAEEVTDLQETNRALQSQIADIHISITKLEKERDILEKEKNVLQERLQWSIAEKDKSYEKVSLQNEELKKENESLRSSISELTIATRSPQKESKPTMPSSPNLPRLLPKSKVWSSGNLETVKGICNILYYILTINVL